MVTKTLLIAVALPLIGFGSTTVQQIDTTATQAILRIQSDQSGACQVKVSQVNDFGVAYQPVNDLNSAYFPGSDQCQREGNLSLGTDWTLVIGKRAAELASDNKTRYSRALATVTLYYYSITVGSDIVTGSFRTQNIALGNTRNDPRFDRLRPGEYADPTIDWNDATKQYVDPKTGVKVARMLESGLLASRVRAAQPFAAQTGGTGWTGSSYNGTSQAHLFLRPTLPSSPALNYFMAVETTTLSATLSGTAASVQVCLTNDGVTCASGYITQAISGTPTAYTIGGTGFGLSDWTTTPVIPSGIRDLRGATGTISKSGATLTWTSGDFFLLGWGAGSTITVGGSTCTISSVNSQRSITVTSSGCASDGAGIAFNGANWGFLLRAPSTSSSTLVVTSPTWGLVTTGTTQGLSSTGASRLCSPIKVTNGSSVQGHFCSGGSLAEAYYTFTPLVFFGDDGSTALVGGMAGSAGVWGNGTCSTVEGPVWDGVTAGKFYCLGSTASKPVLFSVTYTGTYANAAMALDEAIMPVSTAAVSTDLEALLISYTSGYAVPFRAAHCKSWSLLGRVRNSDLIGHCLLGAQDSPGWQWVYRPGTGIVGATSTWTGGVGKPNRWASIHTQGIGGDSGWTFTTANPIQPGYRSLITSGTLTSSLSVCPPNIVDASLTGQTQCSAVTVDTLTPIDTSNGNATLFGSMIGLGDWAYVTTGTGLVTDGEIVRILTISGLTLVVARDVIPEITGTNLNHSGTIGLRMFGSSWSELWWDYLNDPTGISDDTFRVDAQSANCHEVFENDHFLMGCQKGKFSAGQANRNGALPWNFTSPAYFVNTDGGFAGSTYSIPQNLLELHPSMSQYNASKREQATAFDGRTALGDFTATAANTSLVSGQLYKLSASGASQFNYREQGLVVLSGERVLVDVSPSLLSTTSADSFKYCYVVVAGDCWNSSLAGEVYVNAPQVATPYGVISRFVDWPNSTQRDITISQNNTAFGHITQANVRYVDPVGAGVRRLTTAFGPFKLQSIYWNVRPLPDASKMFGSANFMGGHKPEPFVAAVPPAAERDSTARNTWIPVKLSLSGNTGDEVRALFGYAENGPVESFYCHERQQTCSTINSASSFLWVDEGESWTSCNGNCSITIPAISGRAVYYRIERRNGGQIYQSPTEVILTQ